MFHELKVTDSNPFLHCFYSTIVDFYAFLKHNDLSLQRWIVKRNSAATASAAVAWINKGITVLHAFVSAMTVLFWTFIICKAILRRLDLR